MNRLDQIKNEVASKHKYGYWTDLVAQNDLFTIDKYFNEVINQYAKESSAESLKKASENFNIYQCQNLGELRNPDDRYLPADSGWYFAVDKESIINESNIKLL